MSAKYLFYPGATCTDLFCPDATCTEVRTIQSYSQRNAERPESPEILMKHHFTVVGIKEKNKLTMSHTRYQWQTEPQLGRLRLFGGRLNWFQSLIAQVHTNFLLELWPTC